LRIEEKSGDNVFRDAMLKRIAEEATGDSNVGKGTIFQQGLRLC